MSTQALLPDATAIRGEAADDGYLHLLGELQRDPTFILGCHRSGTTFLYQALAAAGQFASITPYDITHYGQLLHLRITGGETAARAALQERLAAMGDNRGIDNIGVQIDAAEEYGFILPKNPARFMFVPQLVPAAFDLFSELCRKKQFLDERPLLLKNPDDFYADYGLIHDRFPASKFLLVHRHPLMVLSSQIAAWTRMVETKNEYFAMLHPLYNALFDRPLELLKHRMTLKTADGVAWMFSEFLTAFRDYLDRVEQIPASLRMVVRYEDLCRDPRTHFAAVCDFLGVAFRPSDYADCVQRRKPHVSPVVDQVYQAMRDRAAFYLEALGYEEQPWELTN